LVRTENGCIYAHFGLEVHYC
jgi:exosome complex protein LRP1